LQIEVFLYLLSSYFFQCPEKNDLWSLVTPALVSWPSKADAGFFIDIYDWDLIRVAATTTNVLSRIIPLCATAVYPCRLSLDGTGGGRLFKTALGAISCEGSKGCMNVQVTSCLNSIYISGFNNFSTDSHGCFGKVSNLAFECDARMATQAAIQVEGFASLLVSNSSFTGCYSQRDGGTIQVYGGATLKVSDSRFKNSRSAGCGGAIAAGGGESQISSSFFEGCFAVHGGGAICSFNYVRYGQLIPIPTSLAIVSSQFKECNSSNTAGAIWATSSSSQTEVAILINGCSFQVFLQNLSKAETEIRIYTLEYIHLLFIDIRDGQRWAASTLTIFT
jgi:hypothetical protein